MAKRKAAKELTAKQQAFVREYLVDLNATAAYARAGYKGSRRAMEGHAARLVGNGRVKAAIAEALGKVAARSAATVERLELELERVALSDPRSLYRPDGTMKPPAEWDDATAATIASVEVVEDSAGATTSKVKRWDKVRAGIELLKRRALAAPPVPPPDHEAMKDSAELVLHRAIMRGEPWAISLFLKCQAKDRGYVERTEHVDIPSNLDDLIRAELDRLARLGAPGHAGAPAGDQQPGEPGGTGGHPG